MTDHVVTPLRREVEQARTPVSVPRMFIVLATMMLAMTPPTALIIASATTRDAPPRMAIRPIVEPGPGLASAPRRPTGPIEAFLQAAVRDRMSALAGCMREWSERSRATVAIVTLAVSFEPTGRVAVLSHTGLHDRITPMCVSLAIRDVRLPLADERVVAEIVIRYLDGKTRVDATVVDVSRGFAQSDTPAMTVLGHPNNHGNGVRQPDRHRVVTQLEAFAIASTEHCPAKKRIATKSRARDLKMTGVVSRGTTRWALFSDTSGKGHIANRNDCLGSEKARIVEIRADRAIAEVSRKPVAGQQSRRPEIIVFPRYPLDLP